MWSSVSRVTRATPPDGKHWQPTRPRHYNPGSRQSGVLSPDRGICSQLRLAPLSSSSTRCKDTSAPVRERSARTGPHTERGSGAHRHSSASSLTSACQITGRSRVSPESPRIIERGWRRGRRSLFEWLLDLWLRRRPVTPTESDAQCLKWCAHTPFEGLSRTTRFWSCHQLAESVLIHRPGYCE